MSTVVYAQRVLAMILACPVGEWVTTKDVYDHMTANGYKIHRRTVERDLLAVASQFGITIGRDAKGHARWWMRCRALEAA